MKFIENKVKPFHIEILLEWKGVTGRNNCEVKIFAN